MKELKLYVAILVWLCAWKIVPSLYNLSHARSPRLSSQTTTTGSLQNNLFSRTYKKISRNHFRLEIYIKSRRSNVSGLMSFSRSESGANEVKCLMIFSPLFRGLFQSVNYFLPTMRVYLGVYEVCWTLQSGWFFHFHTCFSSPDNDDDDEWMGDERALDGVERHILFVFYRFSV